MAIRPCGSCNLDVEEAAARAIGRTVRAIEAIVLDAVAESKKSEECNHTKVRRQSKQSRHKPHRKRCSLVYTAPFCEAEVKS